MSRMEWLEEAFSSVVSLEVSNQVKEIELSHRWEGDKLSEELVMQIPLIEMLMAQIIIMEELEVETLKLIIHQARISINVRR